MRAVLVAAAVLATSHANAAEIIHQQKSLYRNVLVLDHAGKMKNWRCMTFGLRHGYQSCVQPGSDRMVMSYTHALLLGTMINDKLPDRTLIIGLGGGVLPRAMRALNPGMAVDTVELDPAVAEAASRYFDYRPDTHSRLHIDDARVFVRRMIRTGERYDLIIIDAFDKDYIPEHLLSREFIEQVSQLLNQGGVVAANTFSDRRISPYEAATYRSVFGDMLQALSSGGNRILLGRKGRAMPSIPDVAFRAESMKTKLQTLGVSSEQLAHWLRPLPPMPDEDKFILTDQFSPANLLMSRN